MKIQIEKKTFFIYLFLIGAACVSLIFTNVSYDVEYQLSMGYRILKGDAMITEMWEPNQTSVFLCAFLMKLYTMITGTTTGIVLYIQIMGILIRGTVGFLLYKTIKSVADDKIALLAGVFYLLVSPKEILVPDYSNMQLWFATLMLLTLWQYLKTGKILSLLLSAVCLCLGVFAYPSFIVGYVAAFVILWKYSDTFKKDILIFTGVCALIGGTFVAYLLLHIGWDTLMNCVSRALAVEPTHTVSAGQKLYEHFLSIFKVFGMLACVAAMGFVAEHILCFIRKRKNGEDTISFSKDRWWMISWFILMFFLLINILSVKNRGGYAYPFVLIVVLGFLKRKLLSGDEKRFYYMALWIGAMNLLATLILSDNVFLQGVTYALVAICASLLPLYRWMQEVAAKTNWEKYMLCGMHLFLLLIIFRCIYIHIPISGRSQIMSLSSDLGLIRSGPAIGIITNEEGAARQRDSMKEWDQYIQEGDIIWILDDPVDTMGYLYKDVEVGAPSVMSTPTYSDALSYYWELNPDKYPTVVILSSGYGELSWQLLKNEWLMNWLEEEFQADTVIDGNFWRYYIKR